MEKRKLTAEELAMVRKFEDRDWADEQVEEFILDIKQSMKELDIPWSQRVGVMRLTMHFFAVQGHILADVGVIDGEPKLVKALAVFMALMSKTTRMLEEGKGKYENH